MALMVAALVAAVTGLGHVKNAFFPASSLPMFMVEYWLPQGSDIRAVEEDIKNLEQKLLALPAVRHVTVTIGRGAERFMLTYGPELSFPSYAQLIVEVDSYDTVAPTIETADALLREGYPQAFTKFQRFELGPGTKAKVEARLIGPDPAVLRKLSKEVIALRPPEAERGKVSQLEDILVYSPIKQAYVNIGQVVINTELAWEDPLIKRRDRKRTLAVQTDPVPGVMPTRLHARIRGAVEAIPLPPGYSLAWGGEYEAQQKANVAVFAFVPLGVLIMVILTVILFKSAKQALVVWITVSLSVIGVSVGLLTTGAAICVDRGPRRILE